LNPLALMAESGARCNAVQIRQLAGLRGLMARPSGLPAETPIKASFRDGLSMADYFVSTHGARKAQADTTLRTGDAGYLTRKLVAVAQNVVVTRRDCGTRQGIIKSASGVALAPRVLDRRLSEAIRGRVSRATLSAQDQVVVHENELITDALARRIEAMGFQEVAVRSPLTCEAPRGVCRLCYGMDLSTEALVEEGQAVGIIAAQSIGEPGTQFTLRIFHHGGVQLAKDIAADLPRVTDLFEGRAVDQAGASLQ